MFTILLQKHDKFNLILLLSFRNIFETWSADICAMNLGIT